MAFEGFKTVDIYIVETSLRCLAAFAMYYTVIFKTNENGWVIMNPYYPEPNSSVKYGAVTQAFSTEELFQIRLTG